MRISVSWEVPIVSFTNSFCPFWHFMLQAWWTQKILVNYLQRHAHLFMRKFYKQFFFLFEFNALDLRNLNYFCKWFTSIIYFPQFASVKAGDVFSYVVPVSYRMTPLNTSIEEKALFIQAADEVVVYASNKRVSFT